MVVVVVDDDMIKTKESKEQQLKKPLKNSKVRMANIYPRSNEAGTNALNMAKRCITLGIEEPS